MLIRIAIVLLLIFSQVGLFSKAEAGDEEFHLKILEALKRMNARLINIETNNLRSIKDVQESLLNQVMTIQPSIEQIQSTGELNKSEMLASIRRAEGRIVVIENILNTEVMAQFYKKKQEDEKFQIQFSAVIDQLKISLATDMKNISKANEQYFKMFSDGNNEQLQKIANALKSQNKNLIATQGLFKTDLIPALDTQSEETRKALLTELAQARASQKNFLESNHKKMVSSLATIDEKNKMLIEIFKKSILVDENTKILTEEIHKNLTGANLNITQTKKLIDSMQKKLIEQMGKDLLEIKGTQKEVKAPLNNLVNASKKINQETSEAQKNLKISVERLTDSSKSQSELSNEKLSRLIDILKTFAIEQGKVDQALQMFLAEQGKIDQVLQGQKKLDVVMQTQEKVGQALQGQGLESISSQETILKAQQEIKKALKDLRNKANVNISRNDDILKKIKKIK
jgi:hypothetical protein